MFKGDEIEKTSIGAKITSIKKSILNRMKEQLCEALPYLSMLKVKVVRNDKKYMIPASILMKIALIRNQIIAPFGTQKDPLDGASYQKDKITLTLNLAPILLEEEEWKWGPFFDAISTPTEENSTFYQNKDLKTLSLIYLGADVYGYDTLVNSLGYVLKL